VLETEGDPMKTPEEKAADFLRELRSNVDA
jgi:hypothetical protein